MPARPRGTLSRTVPSLSPLGALVLLLLAFLVLLALVLLVLLAFEQRGRLKSLDRKVTTRLGEDRACVLRDVTHGRTKHDSDLDEPGSD